MAVFSRLICPQAVYSGFICSTVVLGSFCYPKVGILPLFRQGPLHLIFIQLLHDSTFVTVYPGRPRECGDHPQLPECILSSGSFGSIFMGSQVELPYRVSGDKQVSIFSSYSRWWGDAFSHVLLSSRWRGGSGGFCKILSFHRWSQYAVK